MYKVIRPKPQGGNENCARNASGGGAGPDADDGNGSWKIQVTNKKKAQRLEEAKLEEEKRRQQRDTAEVASLFAPSFAALQKKKRAAAAATVVVNPTQLAQTEWKRAKQEAKGAAAGQAAAEMARLPPPMQPFARILCDASPAYTGKAVTDVKAFKKALIAAGWKVLR